MGQTEITMSSDISVDDYVEILWSCIITTVKAYADICGIHPIEDISRPNGDKWLSIDQKKLEELLHYSFHQMLDDFDDFNAVLAFHLSVNRIVDLMTVSKYNENIYARDFFSIRYLFKWVLTPEQEQKRNDNNSNAMLGFIKAINNGDVSPTAIPKIIMNTLRTLKTLPETNFFKNVIDNIPENKRKLIFLFINSYMQTCIDINNKD